MTPESLHVTYGSTKSIAELFTMSVSGDTIKLLGIAGSARVIKAVATALTEGGRFHIGKFEKQKYQGCDFQYVVRMKELDKGYHCSVFRSRDPRCLWLDPSLADSELWRALEAAPYETPLLPGWMPALRAILERDKLIHLLRGHNPSGRMLSPELTPSKLDRLVSDGVREKKLVLS